MPRPGSTQRSTRPRPDSLGVLTIARLVCSFAILVIPTAMMGITLPLLSAAVSSPGQANRHEHQFALRHQHARGDDRHRVERTDPDSSDRDSTIVSVGGDAECDCWCGCAVDRHGSSSIRLATSQDGGPKRKLRGMQILTMLAASVWPAALQDGQRISAAGLSGSLSSSPALHHWASKIVWFRLDAAIRHRDDGSIHGDAGHRAWRDRGRWTASRRGSSGRRGITWRPSASCRR